MNEINELSFSILEFILPRLKQFVKSETKSPANLSFKEWINILNEMIGEIENSLKSEIIKIPLFHKYFNELWI